MLIKNKKKGPHRSYAFTDLLRFAVSDRAPIEFPPGRSKDASRPFAIVPPTYFANFEEDYRPVDDARLKAIAPGDFVKLAFDFTPRERPAWVEPAWLKIVDIEEGKLIAEVIRQFVDPAFPGEVGHVLKVTHDLVLDIATGEEIATMPGLAEMLEELEELHQGLKNAA